MKQLRTEGGIRSIKKQINTLKKYIIIYAETQSESDLVEFALIEFNEDLLQKLNAGREALKASIFRVGTIYNSLAEFYTDSTQLPDEVQELIGETPDPIIELSEEQVKMLSKPKQDLEGGELNFSEYCVTFAKYGEHTGEEYWADFYWESFDKITQTIQPYP